jgi:hypothetical protein
VRGIPGPTTAGPPCTGWPVAGRHRHRVRPAQRRRRYRWRSRAGCRRFRPARTGPRRGFHEVAALAAAGVLEGGQHLVEHREPTGHFLGGHRAPGQHPVAGQQLVGLEVGRNVESVSATGSADHRPATVASALRPCGRATL